MLNKIRGHQTHAAHIIVDRLSKQLLANKQALTLVNVLGPLANVAVKVAEQGANN
ncbi:hypothetical protein H5V40_10505 [Lactiplantibacillus plantarum]|nr:hypothetical protein [Lactiplantibacillus plantarum]UTD42162.1 hypothetical protein H5V40_10080 [Lactiplantibacillus plantarum]UTD42164.1 hypothetical protein H5V40_10505 [Lactiplantibacillus plantarum]